jgi:hypothetical protein
VREQNGLQYDAMLSLAPIETHLLEASIVVALLYNIGRSSYNLFAWKKTSAGYLYQITKTLIILHKD